MPVQTIGNISLAESASTHPSERALAAGAERRHWRQPARPPHSRVADSAREAGSVAIAACPLDDWTSDRRTPVGRNGGRGRSRSRPGQNLRPAPSARHSVRKRTFEPGRTRVFPPVPNHPGSFPPATEINSSACPLWIPFCAYGGNVRFEINSVGGMPAIVHRICPGQVPVMSCNRLTA